MKSALRYDKKLDLDDSSSVSKLLRWIKPGSRVLELGPATGYMTRFLAEDLKCEMYCIEIDKDAAKTTEPLCKQMIVGSVEESCILEQLDVDDFDYIIFADVLEHLIDPWKTLRQIRPLLKKDGQCLISIPNVSHAGLISEIMRGGFDYRGEGILDVTHLRFFTRKSLKSLMRDTGFAIQSWDRTVINPTQSEFKKAYVQNPSSIQNYLKGNRDWDTYQFLLCATPFDNANENEIDRDDTIVFHESRMFQIFWDTGTGFNPSQSFQQSLNIEQKSHDLVFELKNIDTLHALRIDPLDAIGAFKLKAISITGKSNFNLYSWNTTISEFPLNAGKLNIEVIDSDDGAYQLSTNEDPYIVIGDLTNTPQELQSPYTVRISITYDTDWALSKFLKDYGHGSTNENIKTQLKNIYKTSDELREQVARYRSLVLSKEEEYRKSTLLLNERTESLLEYQNLAHTRGLQFIRVNRKIKTLSGQNRHLEKTIQGLQGEVAHKNNELLFLLNSRSWKITAPLRKVLHKIRKIKSLFQLKKSCDDESPCRNEASWIRKHLPSEEELENMEESLPKLAYKPLISIILPVYNPEPELLKEALDSVISQIYQNWELCVADDASPKLLIQETLKDYAANDSRIKLTLRKENGHIAHASNSALKLATGEFVAFLDHDDLLTPHALYKIAEALNEDPTLDLIYSNEDKIDIHGNISTPTFKSTWDPDYFMSFMYIGHLSVYRTDLVTKAGGFRPGYEGSQDYDLALRITEITKNIKHLPAILYHWRMHKDSVSQNIHAKPYAFTAAIKSLKDSLKRRGIEGKVTTTKTAGIYKPCYPLSNNEKITVLLYTDTDNVDNEINFFTKDDIPYPNIEIINSLDFVETAQGINSEFTKLDFWKKALPKINSPYILLLDSPLEPLEENWLEALLEQGLRPEVDIVGAKIISEHNQILHAGYTVNNCQVHSNFYHRDISDPGYAARLITTNNVTAVSSACAFMQSELFRKTLENKYTERIAVEIALGMNARHNNKIVLWTPYATFRYCGAPIKESFNLKDNLGDYNILEREFAISKYHDPFYPEGLSTDCANFKIAI